MESFSEGGSSDTASILAGIKNIDRNSIGTDYDGYVGGISQPVNNEDVALLVRCEVISPQPDDESAAGEMAAGDIDYD